MDVEPLLTLYSGAVTGWTGLIRVDNATYIWMGQPTQTTLSVNQTAFEYTSTRSTFTMDVLGQVQMKITFLSPVSPDDLLRSSLPYTYMEVDVQSVDGKQHDVQVYTDISAEWVSGDRSVTAQWTYGVIQDESRPRSWPSPSSVGWPASHSFTTYGTRTAFSVPTSVVHPAEYTHAAGQGKRPTHGSDRPSFPHKSWQPPSNPDASGVAYHQVFRQEQLEFSEINQQAEWGNWYYATSNVATLTHQSGADATVRLQFLANGYLANIADTNYRAINDLYPVFAFSKDLGVVGATSQSTIFQLSLHQKNAVQFLGANGVQSVPSLWTSYFPSDIDALKFFYDDYETGSSLATVLDDKIASDSVAAGGQDYLSLTSLATRQAFGALDWTNTPTEPWVFLKEISSDGNVQTVDVIFPFHPVAIYLNPAILKYLLDPLFIQQEAGNFPQAYPEHDAGSRFGNATGHPDGNAEDQPLEEGGNMLIMTLAYAQRANDNAYLAQHYDILRQWNNYLVDEALLPQDQISTDDFAGSLANQTNLALKGIIGIEAMAQIANRTGQTEDGANFTNIAHSYITQWQALGINYNANPPHTTLSYGQNETYGLLYNLYSDAELGLQLVPQSVYDMQSNFYPTKFNQYGVPLDTRHSYTKNDWELFCAAIASQDTKTEFISTVAKWLGVTPTNFAFTDLYDTVTGNYPPGITFIARPVVGGLYSLLALNSAPSSGYVAA